MDKGKITYNEAKKRYIEVEDRGNFLGNRIQAQSYAEVMQMRNELNELKEVIKEKDEIINKMRNDLNQQNIQEKRQETSQQQKMKPKQQQSQKKKKKKKQKAQNKRKNQINNGKKNKIQENQAPKAIMITKSKKQKATAMKIYHTLMLWIPILTKITPKNILKVFSAKTLKILIAINKNKNRMSRLLCRYNSLGKNIQIKIKN